MFDDNDSDINIDELTKFPAPGDARAATEGHGRHQPPPLRISLIGASTHHPSLVSPTVASPMSASSVSLSDGWASNLQDEFSSLISAIDQFPIDALEQQQREQHSLESQQTVLNQLQDQLERQHAQYSDMLVERDTLLSRIDVLESEAFDVRQQLDSVQRERDSLAASLDDHVQARVKAELAAVRHEVEVRDAKLGKMVAVAREMKTRIDAKEHENAQLSQQLHAEKQSRESLELELRQARASAGSADHDELAQWKERLQQFEMLVRDLNNTVTRQRAEMETMQTASGTERDQLVEDVNQWRAKLGSVEAELQNLRAQPAVDPAIQSQFVQLQAVHEALIAERDALVTEKETREIAERQREEEESARWESEAQTQEELTTLRARLSEAAAKRLEMEEEIKSMILNNDEELDQWKAKTEELESHLAAIQQERQTLAVKLEQAHQLSESRGEFESQLDEWRDKSQRLEIQVRDSTEALTAQRSECESLTAQFLTERRHAAEKEQELQHLRAQFVSVEAELQKLRSEPAVDPDLQLQLEQLQVEKQVLLTHHDAIQGERAARDAAIQSQLTQLQTQCDALIAEKKTRDDIDREREEEEATRWESEAQTQEELRSLRAKLGDAAAKQLEMEEEIKSMILSNDEELDQWKAKTEELEQQLAVMQQERESATELTATTEGELEEWRAKSQQLHSQLQSLSELLAAQRKELLSRDTERDQLTSEIKALRESLEALRHQQQSQPAHQPSQPSTAPALDVALAAQHTIIEEAQPANFNPTADTDTATADSHDADNLADDLAGWPAEEAFAAAEDESVVDAEAGIGAVSAGDIELSPTVSLIAAGAGAADTNVVPAPPAADLSAWQQAVYERDAQIANYYTELQDMHQRYGTLYEEFQRITATQAQTPAQQPVLPVAQSECASHQQTRLCFRSQSLTNEKLASSLNFASEGSDDPQTVNHLGDANGFGDIAIDDVELTAAIGDHEHTSAGSSRRASLPTDPSSVLIQHEQIQVELAASLAQIQQLQQQIEQLRQQNEQLHSEMQKRETSSDVSDLSANSLLEEWNTERNKLEAQLQTQFAQNSAVLLERDSLMERIDALQSEAAYLRQQLETMQQDRDALASSADEHIQARVQSELVTLKHDLEVRDAKLAKMVAVAREMKARLDTKEHEIHALTQQRQNEQQAREAIEAELEHVRARATAAAVDQLVQQQERVSALEVQMRELTEAHEAQRTELEMLQLALSTERDHCSEEVDQWRTNVESLEAELKTLRAQPVVDPLIQSQLTQLQAEHASLTAERDALLAEKELREVADRQREEEESSRWESEAETQEEITSLRARVVEATARQLELEDQMKLMILSNDEELDQWKAKSEELEQQLAVIQNERESLTAELVQARSVGETRDAIASESSEWRDKSRQLETQVRELIERLDAQRSELESLTTQTSAEREHTAELEREVQQWRERCEHAQREMMQRAKPTVDPALQSQLLELRTELSELITERDALLEEKENRDAVDRQREEEESERWETEAQTQEELRSLRAKLAEAVTKQLEMEDELKTMILANDEEVEQWKARIEVLQCQLESLQQEREPETQRSRNHSHSRETVDPELRELRDKSEQLESQIQSLTETLTSQRSELESRAAERDRLTSAVTEWRANYDSVLRSQEALSHDGELMEEENRKLQQDLSTLRQEIDALRQQQISSTQQPPQTVEASSSTVGEAAHTDTLDTHQAQLLIRDAERDQLVSERDQLSNELITLRQIVQTLHQQHSPLQQAHQSWQPSTLPLLEATAAAEHSIVDDASSPNGTDVPATAPAATVEDTDNLADSLSGWGAEESFDIDAEAPAPALASAPANESEPVPVDVASDADSRAVAAVDVEPTPDDATPVTESTDASAASTPKTEAAPGLTEADLSAWQQAVYERDAQIANYYTELQDMHQRYGALYDEYQRLTQAQSSSQAESLPPWQPQTHAEHPQTTNQAASESYPSSHSESQSHSRSSSFALDSAALISDDFPASSSVDGGVDQQTFSGFDDIAIDDAELTASAMNTEQTSGTSSGSASLPPAEVQATLDATHHQAQLQAHAELSEKLVQIQQLQDEIVQLAQHNEQLKHRLEAAERLRQDEFEKQPQVALDSDDAKHALQNSLLFTHIKSLESAVSERDRFITLTTDRLKLVLEEVTKVKAAADLAKAEAAKTNAAAKGGWFARGSKKAETRPEDDPDMEWNGREWVKKPNDDALSALPPLPQRPQPVQASQDVANLQQMSVEQLLSKLGIKAGHYSSTSSPGATAAKSSPSIGLPALGPPKPTNSFAAKPVSARYAPQFDDFGFEAEATSTTTATETEKSINSTPAIPNFPPTVIFTPKPPAPAATDAADPRLHGRTLTQLLDELDAAQLRLVELQQQLAITSSLPPQLPSPNPDHPFDLSQQVAQLKGQLRILEHEKVACELALDKERERVVALEAKIESMRSMEASLIEDSNAERSDLNNDDDDPSHHSHGDHEAGANGSLDSLVRSLKRKVSRLETQLSMARARIRELELTKSAHSDTAALSVNIEALTNERDELIRKVAHLEQQIQQHELHSPRRRRSRALADEEEFLARATPLKSPYTLARPSDLDLNPALERWASQLESTIQQLKQQNAEFKSLIAASTQQLAESASAGQVEGLSVRISTLFVVSLLVIVGAVLGANALRPDLLTL